MTARAIVLQQRMVRPRYRAARGQQDQRIDERQIPRIERVLEEARMVAPFGGSGGQCPP